MGRRMTNLIDPFNNSFDLIALAAGNYDRIDYVRGILDF